MIILQTGNRRFDNTRMSRLDCASKNNVIILSRPDTMYPVDIGALYRFYKCYGGHCRRFYWIIFTKTK